MINVLYFNEKKLQERNNCQRPGNVSKSPGLVTSVTRHEIQNRKFGDVKSHQSLQGSRVRIGVGGPPLEEGLRLESDMGKSIKIPENRLHEII